MNLDNNRCIHDMLKGQCGICDFKPVATPKKVYEHKDLSKMEVHAIDESKDKYTPSNTTIVPTTARVKVKLKPRRLNGRSSRRK